MSIPKIQQKILSNGLTLVGESNPLNKSAAIGFFVRTGSRDETKRESGVSHFLEHMMFKGTPKRNAIELTHALGNIGAQANAYTSEENTVYYASIIPEYFPAMQEVLSDMLRSTLDPHEFDTEKKVILEEIALYQDRPVSYLLERVGPEYFVNHPTGNSVLGTTQSITALSRDEMKDYFDRRYSPANMTLVASGNFSWERFVAYAEQYCGWWKRFEPGRVLSRHHSPVIKRTFTKPKLKQSHVVLLTSGPSAQDENRYAASLLSVILGDSGGSKLYWALVDSGLAEAASIDSDEKDGTGVFMAYACTEPDQLDRVTDLLRSTLDQPLDFTESDLDRSKMKLLTRVVLNGELPLGRMMALGNSWTYNKELPTLQETISRLRKVTRKDIEQLLEQYPLKNWAEFRLVPE